MKNANHPPVSNEPSFTACITPPWHNLPPYIEPQGTNPLLHSLNHMFVMLLMYFTGKAADVGKVFLQN
jgi:hypothetical protein